MPTRPTKKAAAVESPISDLMQAVGVLVRRVRAESGADALSWSQSAAMARLETSGPMTTAELARAEMVKPQSMGTLLAELEQEGLVQRQPHPTDGRQILFSLTAQGLEARRQRHAAKIAWLTTAMDQFDANERRTLVDAIALIRRLGER
jgi:DNA-binding MarR family transcriptional regulator